MAKKLTKKKAREILKHGSVHGKKLTNKQKRFFGARSNSWLSKEPSHTKADPATRDLNGARRNEMFKM